MLFARDVGGAVAAIDTTSWAPVTRWTAHDANVRGLTLSPDGDTLVTTGEDGFVNVWDVSDIDELGDGVPPTLLDRVPTPIASDAVWVGDDQLMVFLREGARHMTVSLDVEDLVDEARARLTRGFTPEECATYRIEDCPTTLDVMRRG